MTAYRKLHETSRTLVLKMNRQRKVRNVGILKIHEKLDRILVISSRQSARYTEKNLFHVKKFVYKIIARILLIECYVAR